MKKIISTISDGLLKFFIILSASPVWAVLPEPPDSDMATSDKDWIDVGSSLMNRVISIACIAIGAILLIGVAGSILKAYHVAHEKQDLGHFFKMLVVGLLVAAIGLGLVYAGYSIVTS